MNQRKPRPRIEEKGMVSIIVTMVMIVVITLIVIGFARITRRDQRQIIDNQLSTQAFYAAESGVNDVIKNLSSITSANTGCTDLLTPNGIKLQNVLGNNSGISYTCLLVNPAPNALGYGAIDTQKSTVIPLNVSSPIDSIKLSWQSANLPPPPYTPNLSCPAIGTFPDSTSYTSCDAGMFRIDLVPVSGVLTRSGLANSDLAAVLQPKLGGSGSLPAASMTGATADANCNTASSPLCTLTITGLSMFNATNYMIRIRSLYVSNSLTIQAFPVGSTTPLNLSGAQAVIDSTGKANDVLRRIVVRVKTAGNYDGIPEFAIQSQDTICKRFYTYSGTSAYDDNNGLVPSGINGAGLGKDMVCDPTQK